MIRVCIFVIQAYITAFILERVNTLHPKPVVNILLRALVRMILSIPVCESSAIQSKHAALAKRLRDIASIAECHLEHHWAHRILNSKDAELELEKFPYLSCYSALTQTERQAIAEYAPNARNIIFVGCGSLPLSAIMFARAGYNVTLLDTDTYACENAQQLVDRLGLSEQLDVIHGDALSFGEYRSFDVVILAALAGAEENEKTAIIKKILAALNPHARLFARSVDGLCSFLYPEISRSAEYLWSHEIGYIAAVQEKHINSLVIYQAAMKDVTTRRSVDRLKTLFTVYKQLDDAGARAVIGDMMRFDTPLVWLGYKYEAYQGTDHAVITINDLRIHCSEPGDICEKRFHFLNDHCEKNGFSLMKDCEVVGSDAIVCLWENEKIRQVLSDENMLRSWCEFEYYERDGEICKWQNYSVN